MYLTSEAVVAAISELRASVHPFLGITFVACKAKGLSIGSTDNVSLDGITRDHMDRHHRIDRRSARYFQPFKGSAAWWVVEKYPSSGLQTVNTQTFGSAFIHPRGTREWGFADNYINVIEQILSERQLATEVPGDALAVWLLKGERLADARSYADLVDIFSSSFNISEEERSRIFCRRVMEETLPFDQAVSTEPLEMTSVARRLPPPPDAEQEGGRTIVSLNLTNAGPATALDLDYGSRLTMITGDNGLGKSFLLDFTWWAATGAWVERPFLPSETSNAATPSVEYALSGRGDAVSSFRAVWNAATHDWDRPGNVMTIDALAVFSRADGSFAVADPVRTTFNQPGTAGAFLTAREVWDGKPGMIEGLVRDWVKWQSADDQKTFDLFTSVLKRLSPEDLGTLCPGDPIRLPGDPREIPTIEHRYGTIPVTQASSGVQRVLLLAYLIIWSWQEHELASERLDRDPLRRMLVIVDELEAHLHPKWQRIVLPALLSTTDLLSSDLALQVIAATHSPMILASMETEFDQATDLLYHLYGDGPSVKLEETPFVKYGDASGWLTSPLFGLKHARSREAERAIEAAKALQLAEAPAQELVREVTQRLKNNLASDDKFWPRWLFFAEKNGVEV